MATLRRNAQVIKSLSVRRMALVSRVLLAFHLGFSLNLQISMRNLKQVQNNIFSEFSLLRVNSTEA
jgi:hypothetical protein